MKKYTNFITRCISLFLICFVLYETNRFIVGQNIIKAERIEQQEQSAAQQASADSTSWDSSQMLKLKDGTYTGEAQGFGGIIQVKVTIAEDKITAIDIISAENEDKVYLDMAKDVISRIIQTNETGVDTVSGATFSSNGIINAVKEAIEKAQ